MPPHRSQRRGGLFLAVSLVFRSLLALNLILPARGRAQAAFESVGGWCWDFEDRCNLWAEEATQAATS